jgi:hypothetical protein
MPAAVPPRFRHFDAIDTGRRGAVTFDDVRAYLARAKAERR